MKTAIFKIKFRDQQSVTRMIEVKENINLYKLAEAIIKAVGFQFDHCFGFFSETRDYYKSSEKYELFADMPEEEPVESKSVKKTKIKTVWPEPEKEMLFLFDYGDEWLLLVKLIGRGEEEEGVKYPRVIESNGKAPQQYPEID